MSRRLVWLAPALAAGAIAGVAGGLALRGPPPDQPVPQSATAPPPAQAAAEPPPPATFDPVFQRCAHCHQIGAGARNASGPSLQGILGRRAGSIAGYPSSPAMRQSGVVWNETALSQFIAAPQDVVPGNRMIFPGLPDPAERAAIVAFIAAQGR